MIINPIIPIWLMVIIAVILIAVSIRKKHIASSLVKVLIVLLLFVMNLRFMLPNGETTAINSDLNILFVIDKSVSMRALDYNGQNERFEGVINDCCNIVNELSSCKFSIITFGDTAQKLIPFTNDTDMVQAELKAISLENSFYAKGSSMNIVKDTLRKTLEEETKRKNNNAKYAVFFISDGEITKEGEKLQAFADIKKYVSNGAVMGYGTQTGGKMKADSYDTSDAELKYIYYYDENYNRIEGVSKLDEKNLNKIAQDLGIDYIQMSKPSNINYKLNDIKRQISNSQTNEEKIASYADTYYYLAIPLMVLLIVNFIIQKRRMQ